MRHQGSQFYVRCSYVLVAILVFATMSPSFATKVKISPAKKLKSYGIDPNDLPDVRRLAKSAPRSIVRLDCIRYLASKITRYQVANPSSSNGPRTGTFIASAITSVRGSTAARADH